LAGKAGFDLIEKRFRINVCTTIEAVLEETVCTLKNYTDHKVYGSV
jgi:hypothetical protein